MDIPTILAKLVGLGLLVWTIISIVKHVKRKRAQRGEHENQSVIEQILNGVLLYLWLAFMLVFSTGMILNN